VRSVGSNGGDEDLRRVGNAAHGVVRDDLFVDVDVFLPHVRDDPHRDVCRVDAAETRRDDDQLGVDADVAVHVVHGESARYGPLDDPLGPRSLDLGRHTRFGIGDQQHLRGMRGDLYHFAHEPLADQRLAGKRREKRISNATVKNRGRAGRAAGRTRRSIRAGR
jgi:hypothetical protein